VNNSTEVAYRQRIKRVISDTLESMKALEGEHGRAWAALQDSKNSDPGTLKLFSERLRKTAAIIDKTIEALAEEVPVGALPKSPILLEWIASRCERTEPRFTTPTRPLYEDYNRFAGEVCSWETFLDLLEGAGIEVHGRSAYDANARGTTIGGLRLRKPAEAAEDAA
jgi:hypothetical protein